MVLVVKDKGFMDVNAEGFVKELIAVLQREIKLHQEYVKLLEEEGRYLIRFNEEKVTSVTLARANLYNELLDAQQERIELSKAFEDYSGMRLCDLVRKYMYPQNAKRILPLINQLREAAKKSTETGKQHSQILDFGLRAVHGVMSIIRSGSLQVVKSYTRKGGIRILFLYKNG